MWRWLLSLLLFAEPVFGIIENTQVGLTGRNPVSLRGLWDFTAPGISKRLRVDKEWRLQGVAGVNRATFSLTIGIPQNLRTGDFALILPPVSAAIRILLNGNLIAEKGRVSSDLKYPENSSEAFAWYPVKRESLVPAENQVLSLEITGFQEGGGTYGNAHIYFGGLEEIKNKYNFIFLVTVFLAAAIFMIALFHFALVPDRNYRRANLHYVLLSFAMACHILGINGLGYYLFNNFLFNAALIHIIIAAFPFALIGFSLRYFRLRYTYIRRGAYVYGAVMSVVLVICAVNPAAIPAYLRYGLPTGFTLMGGALVFALYAAIRGILAGIEGAKIVLLGFVIYSITVLNDILFYFSYDISVKIADAGFLFAVLCIAVALAGRLHRATQEKDELREWKKEISLAAQIQSLALPKRSLETRYLHITTLFKPMKIIGGDFFAFHEISETATGIFIADVSGHGIAAALMVNTIKSIFLQQREHALEPATLMRNMNVALFPHLQEQFITAAYCVLDFDTQKIRVAQAGHPPLYFLHRDGRQIEKIKPKGKFFGFAEDLYYEIVEVDLSLYSRIFLYSDGVIEAGSLNGIPYSVPRLEKFLLESGKLTGSRLLEELEKDIHRNARTEMNTDDDSSCVVIDLTAA